MNHENSKTPDAENPEFSDELIGQRFGVYQIAREIGRGGMGVVYLAERIDGAFKQNVAIKFVKRGMDTDSILKRFRNERQILASLSHPNVALLYDGGTTSTGLPYFVMEFVAGEPLYQYCDRRKLNLKERLKVFVQVCQAVHAAHQIKVVHRDLKPSNILVKANGTPKLLDFGIAKLLDPEIVDVTIEPTASQMRMMTPEYASPEQVSGGEITTASDIYSLGVLLYELLSGHRPYRLKNRSPHEIARVICEESPESLGESLESKGTFLEKSEVQTLEKVLESRGSNLAELRREFAGELEQIVMNALHKKPSNRYQTALELAEDIQFYLKGKPIKKRFLPSLPQAKDDKTTLAVLPLKIIGEAVNGDAYLAVGLADAIISRLTNVKRFIVRPTNSILNFENSGSPFEAGKRLKVNYLLTGNIRCVNGNYRITAQLLDVHSSETIWSQQFDEKTEDIFELEDMISRKVALALLPQLDSNEKIGLEKRYTLVAEAYNTYLRGRYFWNKLTPESLFKSLEMFERAISLDPKFALAYVGIADFYVWFSAVGLAETGKSLKKAKAAAETALEIDPTLIEANYPLASYEYVHEHNQSKGEYLLKQLIKSNPNYWVAYEALAFIYASQSDFEKSIENAKKAESLNPLSTRSILSTAWCLYLAGKFEASAAKVRESLDLEPNFLQGMLNLANAQIQLGKSFEAIQLLETCLKFSPDWTRAKSILSFALVATGNRTKAEEILAELEKQAQTTYVSPFFIGSVCVAVNQTDKAFVWFDKACEEHSTWLIWLENEINFAPIRNDKRFAELVNRVKFTD